MVKGVNIPDSLRMLFYYEILITKIPLNVGIIEKC